MKILLTIALSFGLVAVFADAKPRAAINDCPPGVPTANCFVAPCQVTTCPGHPYATCRDNYCGGCNAEFYDVNGVNVTGSCKLPAEDECPPGVPIVQCFVDPCQVTKCPAHPGATCRSNFCGGCNAFFFDSNNVNVTSTC
ncbi:hypothetical protein BV898_14471 [Hypsibius exemplaris]|uniref:Uncharacterized protein n=1 Tax=Hypsibius exemplaris TaxID=2072580 RepID=A0A9X6N8T4_HYPEX|nr:hypothetical protein BV898_14471 [Hypsibius exemplaris]